MVDHRLVLAQDLRHAGAHRFRHGPGPRQQFFGRDDVVDQAPFVGLPGVDRQAGEGDLPRPRQANQARQALAEPPAGQDAHPRVGVGETGMLRGDQQVAGQGQLETAGNRVAIDGADNRAVEGFHGTRHGIVDLLGGSGGMSRAQLLQVKAGTEGVTGTGNDQYPYLGVGRAVGHGVHEGGAQFPGQGIFLCRSIEGENGMARVFFQ